MRHSPNLRTLIRLGAALLVVAPGLARAEPAPRTSSLGWVRLPGAESCVGPRALALAVERRLQREVFVSPARAALAVEGRIERTTAPPGFRAVITISNDAGAVLGNRELHSTAASCGAMDDDLALVIAVMIDPEAALAPALPAAAKPRSPPPVVPAPVAPPSPAPPSWHFSVQGGAEAMLGLLPRLGGGVVLRSHIEPPHFWSFEIGGVVFLPSTAQQDTLGASFRLAEAFVSTCPFTFHAFGGALEACGGVQLGDIHAGGFGFPLAHVQNQLVFNVAVEARVRRRIVGPLMVAGGLGLVFPVLRERFSYTDTAGTAREIFQMSPVAGAGDVSVGVEFP